MSVLGYILVSTVIVSLLSLIGGVILITKKNLEHMLFLFVAFAAGAMLSVAFFDLIPESTRHMEEMGATSLVLNPFIFVLLGFVAFFVLERFVFWRHHHHVGGQKKNTKKQHATFTYMNLVGDGLHNLIDGAIIAIAYLVNVPLGIMTTIAVIFHEIPQEISDFSVLLYGGFKPKKALLFNLLSALSAIVGSVVTYKYATVIEGLIPFLLAFAAGSFIYIATVDLIPELHRERHRKKAVLQVVAFLAGIGVMYSLGYILPV